MYRTTVKKKVIDAVKTHASFRCCNCKFLNAAFAPLTVSFISRWCTLVSDSIRPSWSMASVTCDTRSSSICNRFWVRWSDVVMERASSAVDFVGRLRGFEDMGFWYYGINGSTWGRRGSGERPVRRSASWVLYNEMGWAQELRVWVSSSFLMYRYTNSAAVEQETEYLTWYSTFVSCVYWLWNPSATFYIPYPCKSRSSFRD